ncbi:hypothetical protein ACFOZ0_19510 [Streptomyces yaanensis]|uniref:Uncharacterized protein n=1 Tax=Streptomyces yaanensis TaxID=1142239 RepID=A0ABV7SHV2_9ACTN|nr:hypothetical protein [Streptomyces sp. CGMCC 4.7035]WNB97956.1 hypothetical protein Q2K21_07590 [Streptomyces sp. CGMCC 4.7035]
MIEYELQQIRSAELIRAAEEYRIGREALRLRRAAHRTAKEPEPEGRAHGHRRRPRVARAA